MGTLNTVYMQSDNVKVFPTTKRPNYQSDSSFLNEANLVSIVNRLLDTDTFVINYNSESDIISFNLKGYYFRVSNVSQLVQNPEIGDNLYVSLRLVDIGEYTELYGTDENQYYTGLLFVLNNNNLSIQNRFKILTYTETDNNPKWQVPKESFYKYNSRSLYGTIDCGEI